MREPMPSVTPQRRRIIKRQVQRAKRACVRCGANQFREVCEPCHKLVRAELAELDRLDPDGKTRAILEALRDLDEDMGHIGRRLGVSLQRVSKVFKKRRELDRVLRMHGR